MHEWTGVNQPLSRPHLLRQNQVRLVRGLVRVENLACRHQIRKTHLAVQPQIRRWNPVCDPSRQRRTNHHRVPRRRPPLPRQPGPGRRAGRQGRTSRTGLHRPSYRNRPTLRARRCDRRDDRRADSPQRPHRPRPGRIPEPLRQTHQQTRHPPRGVPPAPRPDQRPRQPASRLLPLPGRTRQTRHRPHRVHAIPMAHPRRPRQNQRRRHHHVHVQGWKFASDLAQEMIVSAITATLCTGSWAPEYTVISR